VTRTSSELNETDYYRTEKDNTEKSNHQLENVSTLIIIVSSIISFMDGCPIEFRTKRKQLRWQPCSCHICSHGHKFLIARCKMQKMQPMQQLFITIKSPRSVNSVFSCRKKVGCCKESIKNFDLRSHKRSLKTLIKESFRNAHFSTQKIKSNNTLKITSLKKDKKGASLGIRIWLR
jgi:hypothetical protein